MDIKKMTFEFARQSNKAFPNAFKLLGLLLFIFYEGNEPLLSGEMISPRTYYRWVEKINQAGYGDLLADVRLKQVISEFVNQRFSDLSPIEAKPQILEVVNNALDSIHS